MDQEAYERCDVLTYKCVSQREHSVTKLAFDRQTLKLLPVGYLIIRVWTG